MRKSMLVQVAGMVALGAMSAAAAMGQDAGALSKTLPNTPHVTITAEQSAAALGKPVKLDVVIVPGPDTHLYAPGAEKYHYRVSVLTVTPSPLYRASKVSYPASEMLTLPDLGQTVPVYTGKTVFSTTVTPAGKSTKPVTVKGVVLYQPCTSKVCFPPVTVPVSWELGGAAGDSR